MVRKLGSQWPAMDSADPPPPSWQPGPPPPPGAWVPPPAAPPQWNPWGAPPPPAGGGPGAPGAIPGWDPRPVRAPTAVGSGSFRARGVGELLDGAFTLYRRNFLLIVAIAAAVQVPFALIQLALYRAADLSGHLSSINTTLQQINARTQSGLYASSDQIDTLKGDAGALIGTFVLVFAIQYLVVRPLAEAATTRAVSDRYLDRPSSVGSSYGAALRRLPALIAMTLLLTLGATALAAVVIVAAVVAGAGGAVLVGLLALVAMAVGYVRVRVAAQAIVLEGVSGVRGLRRSWSLLRGAFWRTFGILGLLALIELIVSGIVTLPVTAATSGLDSGSRQLLQTALGAVATVFVAPITLITLTLYYYDARIRREAFDIEMLAASL